MTVGPGQTLQHYRLMDKVGEGGMGEVWRAVDTSLDREVAIKILPESVAANPDRLLRFEREAKAVAALAHPNILTVYDFGRVGATTYMVTELLDGETLRARLAEGPLPQRKAAELARQIARGLAAAHEKGFVHRDLKPENVFVTGEGRAKILDFGLAASTLSAAGTDTHTPTATGLTAPGAVLGTVDYMSPEQVRGEAADHRSDIFSFGTLLYEMLTGGRPFHRDTAAETMTAVLREDPPEPSEAGSQPIPPALERVVRRCLEKRCEERFQSASDLAFAVENALGTTSTGSGRYEALAAAAPAKRRSWMLPVALVVLATLGFVAGRFSGTPVAPQPKYSQLTFRQGRISAALFAADGGTVVYSAAWDGSATRLYTVHEGSPESRSLDIEDVELLSISSQGELAILLQPRFVVGWTGAGTLARMPLGGAAPREILDDIGSADWDPAGEQLAVARADGSFWRLEYPPGNVLFETNGWIGNVRFSPDGRHIAYSDHPGVGDNRGFVAVTDLDGDARRLGPVWSALTGIAWSPDGTEIVFTAGVSGTIRELRATDLDGSARLLSSAPVDLLVHDVSPDGRVLISRNMTARRIVGRSPDAKQEIGLSWLDWSYPDAISPDGSRILFTEQGEGGGPVYRTYMRPTAGGPAILLGDGQAQAFSPDGTRVASALYDGTMKIAIYPIGAGEPETIELPEFGSTFLSWTEDPGRMLILGAKANAPYRAYVLDLDSHEVEPVSPENVRAASVVIHPESGRFTGRVGDGPLQVFSIHGEDPITLTDVQPPWLPAGFGEGGESIFIVEPGRIPLPVVRYEIDGGERETIWEFMPAEAAGLLDVGPAYLTPDGRAYLYSFRRYLSTLYVVEGL